MNDKGIIFLTGVGRSGTTLLQTMLNSHSEINFPPETHFFKRYILPYMRKGQLPVNTTLVNDKFLQRLPENQLKTIAGLKYEDLSDLLKAFEFIMSSSERDVSVIADKDTEYVRYLPHLKKIYPEAYLIHIKRDPRDVVASRLNTSWGSKRSFHFHVAEYQYYIKKIRVDGQNLFQDKFIELKYEELLVYPEKVLRKILSRLNLVFEPKMLDFYQEANKLISVEEKDWKGNVSKPIDPNNQGKWKKNISVQQALLIQTGIEDYFEENGYEKVRGKASFIDLLRVRILSVLFHLKTLKEKIN